MPELKNWKTDYSTFETTIKVWIQVSEQTKGNAILASTLIKALAQSGVEVKGTRRNKEKDLDLSKDLSIINNHRKTMVKAIKDGGKLNGVNKTTLDAWEERVLKKMKDVVNTLTDFGDSKLDDKFFSSF